MAKPTKLVKKRKQSQGRPEIPLDFKVIDHLLECGCTGEEVAAYLGIHSDTLFRRICKEKKVDHFTTYATEKRQKGDSLLREAQMKAAIIEKDKAMMIWLGKQRLGQKEKSESEQTVTLKLGKDNPESEIYE